jgi:hypothetical protein
MKDDGAVLIFLIIIFLIGLWVGLEIGNGQPDWSAVQLVGENQDLCIILEGNTPDGPATVFFCEVENVTVR